MRNGAYSRAELALIDLEWLARGLLQMIEETKADAPGTVARVLDSTTAELDEIRQTFMRTKTRHRTMRKSA